MARKKKQAGHENLERWLISYADFITLMFAFFVVMFASSQADKGKAAQVSESIRKALQEGQVASAIAGILGGTVDDKGKGNAQLKGPGGAKPDAKHEEARERILAELLPSLQFLSQELKAEIASGKLQIKLQARGLVVSLMEAAFFPSGADTIDPRTYPTIGKIAGAIRGLPNPVRLEGHTDAVPIHNVRFVSNWELSAARAVAMLRLLNERFQVPFERMAIAGYAETAPADTNQTAEGRARNRRVDLVILNKIGLEVEPPLTAPAAAAPAPAAAHSAAAPHH
jgi:chemotaxis protein MotB